MNTTTEFLQKQSLFQGLTTEELSGLAALFVHRRHEAESVIVHQGEISEDLFVVFEGFVNISRGNLRAIEPEVFISTLGQGDCFGEAALFHEVKRTANVKAFDACETLSIGKPAFVRYLKENPIPANRILYQILKNLFFRLEQTSSELQFERKSGLTQNTIDQIIP